MKYSFFETILHKQFLGNTGISKYLYQRLCKSSLIDLKSFSNKKHIFITGLARAGTTALLNKIYSSGEFGSFLYRYMPFILSPNLAKIYSKYLNTKNIQSFERLHNDKILISSDSPECLDEPYWIKALDNLYAKSSFRPIDVSLKTLCTYDYLLEKFSAIQHKERMVIKNNNHHWRIKSLSKYFISSSFLVLFRSPINHAYSLMNQHHNFQKIQLEDSFVLDYMNLMGHYEFGLNMKDYKYSQNLFNKIRSSNKNQINYWLCQWINTYNWILTEKVFNLPNVYLISYEDISNNKYAYEELCINLKIKNKISGLPFSSSNIDIDETNIRSELINKAQDIYKELKKLSCF